MSETSKMTRKDLFAKAKVLVPEDEVEIQEMFDKYIEQLSKPRKPKVNEEALAFAEVVYDRLASMDAAVTNKEISESLGGKEMNASPQRVAAALRKLVESGRVVRTEGEKKSDRATFVVA